MNSVLKARILYKLARLRKWGASHTSIDNVLKGFPSHLKSDVKKSTKELIKEQLILKKPTSYGLEISLNPKRKTDIIKLIKMHFPIIKI